MENLQDILPLSSSLWHIDTKNSRPDRLEIFDPEGWYKARLGPTGDVLLTRFNGVPFGKEEDDVYLHRSHFQINDIDSMIARLTEIRNLRNEAFGNLCQSDNSN